MMDATQAARTASLLEKCAAEIEEVKRKQKNEYDVLVSKYCLFMYMSTYAPCCARTAVSSAGSLPVCIALYPIIKSGIILAT